MLEERLALQTLESALKNERLLEEREQRLVCWRSTLTVDGVRALAEGKAALWKAGESEKQWSRAQGEELREHLQGARVRSEQAKDYLMERRSTRKAVETLVEEAVQKARYERERGEQQALDEWFQIAGGKSKSGCVR